MKKAESIRKKYYKNCGDEDSSTAHEHGGTDDQIDIDDGPGHR